MNRLTLLISEHDVLRSKITTHLCWNQTSGLILAPLNASKRENPLDVGAASIISLG